MTIGVACQRMLIRSDPLLRLEARALFECASDVFRHSEKSLFNDRDQMSKTRKPLSALVIGSGLIGVASAYFLRKRGFTVTVVDRQAAPGLETSFANGSLQTPSMAEPWNTPGCWRTLLRSIGRQDSAMQLRLRALPGLARWGIDFLRNSAPEIYRNSIQSNLRLALFSQSVMSELQRDTRIEYGRSAVGYLRVFRDSESFRRARAAAASLAGAGLRFRVLPSEKAVEFEPALQPIRSELAGAIHYGSDETGN